MRNYIKYNYALVISVKKSKEYLLFIKHIGQKLSVF